VTSIYYTANAIEEV